MSSALVWLPPGKYGSVEPLWKNQYVWSPLPVDNSLPLHQTSFLDIDEGESAAARSRSRADTLASESNALLANPDSSVVRAGDALKENPSAPGATWPAQQGTRRALETIRQSLNNPTATEEARAAVAELLVPRPLSLKETRLHSFHLNKADGKPAAGVAKSPLGIPQEPQNGESRHGKLVESPVTKTRRPVEAEKLARNSATKPRRVAEPERREAEKPHSVPTPTRRSRPARLTRTQTGEPEQREADKPHSLQTPTRRSRPAQLATTPTAVEPKRREANTPRHVETPTKRSRAAWLAKPETGEAEKREAERRKADIIHPVETPKKRPRAAWLEKPQTDAAEIREANNQLSVVAAPRTRSRAARSTKSETGNGRTASTSSQDIVKRDRHSPPIQESPLPRPVAPAAPQIQRRTKPMGQTLVTLHLNLEIEVQLKTVIKGDLTLTLFE